MQTINDRIGIILEKTGKTKTAFAESLKVSQQYISKLIKTGNPSDMLIEDICQKYGINEDWLRYGKGEMKVEVNPDTRYANNLAKLAIADDETIMNWVNMIAETNPSILKEIESFFKTLIGINEEKPD